MLHKNRIRNFETQLTIMIVINEAIAYLAHGLFGLGGGNGSMPISKDVANISRSSSIVTMLVPDHGMSSNHLCGGAEHERGPQWLIDARA